MNLKFFFFLNIQKKLLFLNYQLLFFAKSLLLLCDELSHILSYRCKNSCINYIYGKYIY